MANILSGNYCQPKCAEPWVEVKFEDEKQGKIQVVASPLIRLTNKPNATIEDIGTPEKLIASLGPFVTGNTYDPDELLESSVEKLGDQTVKFLPPYFSQYLSTCITEYEYVRMCFVNTRIDIKLVLWIEPTNAILLAATVKAFNYACF